MLAKKICNTNEVFLGEDELIISKTDLKGRITYANRTFIRVAGFDEEELLHKPHNLIRHPDMPKGVFKYLWSELRQGREFFGFVKNYTEDRRFYWVLANITPDMDAAGEVQGYFSVRRCPHPQAIATIEPIYRQMLAIESRYSGSQATEHSLAYLQQLLDSKSLSYEQFVLQLQNGHDL